ncbi:MAG: hypothetical protein C0520_02060 [Sphingopyxis sp.]|nr:hypothetical protein [Sphingopyxis sp.]
MRRLASRRGRIGRCGLLVCRRALLGRSRIGGGSGGLRNCVGSGGRFLGLDLRDQADRGERGMKQSMIATHMVLLLKFQRQDIRSLAGRSAHNGTSAPS